MATTRYDESVAPEACKASLDLMNSQVGTFDIYNVYDTCVDDYAGDDQRVEHESKKKTNRQWREEIFGARGVSTVGKFKSHQQQFSVILWWIYRDSK